MAWWPYFIVRPRVRIGMPRLRQPTWPPSVVVFALAISTIIFVLGGNIYTLIMTPPPIASFSNGLPRLLAPGIDAQLSIEGIVASVVAFIGVLGLGLMYYSSRYIFTPSHATRMMIVGMLLAGVALLTYNYMYAIKMDMA
ncbi:MAG: hypothetical protein ACXADF_07980 [Candidatus Thorarchaeota archaeon]